MTLGDGQTTDVDLSLIEQGIYLIGVTFLYSSWEAYSLGVLIKYNDTTNAFYPISERTGGHLDNGKLHYNQIISSCVLIKFGYWS